MKMRYFFSIIVIVLFLSFLGCKSSKSGGGGGGGGGDPVVTNPGFAEHIQVIFTGNCAISGCHDQTARAGLELSQGQAYGNIVNVPSNQVPTMMRVLPSDAANSYLIMKLEGTQSVGSQMPLQGSITNNQLQTIKNWINNGAPNN